MNGWINQPEMESLRLRGTQKVAVTALFTALAVTTDYMMLPLANIKLMDTIVFVSALVFGLGTGVSVGALTWLVYGTVNPLGSAFGPLLVILIASETVYALMGSLARRAFNFDAAGIPVRSLIWGCLGLIGAFIYDVITILVPTMMTGVSLAVAVTSFVPAIPFMLAHEISDFAFFATAGPILVGAIFKVIKPSLTQRPFVDYGGMPASRNGTSND